ncbi:Flp pilus assembly protein CpaB [Gluconacetobacter sacchari]|uniref:Flp pilus assembly protein CpaB n=1 Tax=Gluconacetobacter sacchari TaxID=92759 RepID=UPI0039B473DE
MFRFIVFVLLAIGLGGFGTAAWIAIHPPAAGPPARKAIMVQVVAASRALGGGYLLKPADMTTIAVSRGREGPDAIAASPEALAGAMMLHAVSPGAILRAGDLLRPGDRGFLAVALHGGMRAVTIGVDTITGTAGLIWPGDHVDLILTQLFPAEPRPERRVAAETVLSNVRVIAIDRRLVQGDDAAKEPAARTATLELTALQAEQVSVATRMGRLSLVVRSARSDDEPEPAPGAAWAGDVSRIVRDGTVAAPSARSVTVYQGSAEGQEVRF